jgi:SPP1 gp7 family putative phage head morphogenesis protein
LAANNELIEKAARHSVYVQRFAGGLDDKFLPYLERLKTDVELVVLRTDPDTVRSDQLLQDLGAVQQAIYNEYETELQADLSEFVVDESEYEARALGTVVDADVSTPGAATVLSALAAATMVFPYSNVSKTARQFVTDWTASETRRVNNVVSTGIATGQTQRQIVRATNAVLDKNVKGNNQTVVSTVTNHTSAVGRTETWRENDDLITGYIWVTILDNRACQTCISLDSEVFNFSDPGFKPMPAIHPRCRCSISVVFDGRKIKSDGQGQRPAKGDDGKELVGATSNYYGWLKRQKAEFQDAALGPTRGRLLRNGGLTAEEFRRLSVDSKYRPLTLAEMRQKNPDAFEESRITI